MILLLSPTKTQVISDAKPLSEISFKTLTSNIWNSLESMDLETLKTNFKVSDKIASSIHEYFKNFDPKYPAILTYQGSTFKNMNIPSWDNTDLDFAQKHLIILSALFGPLKPFDAISLYRLDFNTKMPYPLYDLWKEPIIEYFNKRNEVIVSLASVEYESMLDVDKILNPVIRIQFLEKSENDFVIKATYAKIARGKMARIIIQSRYDTVDDIKKISFDNYTFNKLLSKNNLLVFTR